MTIVSENEGGRPGSRPPSCGPDLAADLETYAEVLQGHHYPDVARLLRRAAVDLAGLRARVEALSRAGEQLARERDFYREGWDRAQKRLRGEA